MKKAIKRLAYLISIVIVLPIWLFYLLESLVLGKEKSFPGFSQYMSLFPGISGNYLRYGFYKLTLDRLGEDACICFGVTLVHPGIRIGKGVYIGPFCNLGLCTIEDDVLLATEVHVMSGFQQHGYESLDIPIREQEGKLTNIRIGAGSWIGNKAVIGSHVGEKSIIGAASLVNKEIPPYSIAVGNPAKVIRDRREK